MQKWEYLRIDISFGNNNVLLVSSVNGRSIGEKKGVLKSVQYPSFDSYIEQLGEQGWELIAVTGRALPECCLFKRSKV
ncbi:MAG: hypothetical protein KDI62_09755 [Anaerolineae bacterium]|nr:hypothetical protein [Anaerolineae bacterium]MCB9109081.1 hypothetical protein [Anaerolineales bacterium]